MRSNVSSVTLVLLTAAACTGCAPTEDAASADQNTAEARARCGRENEACCAGNTCRAGLNCNFNAQVCTASCGALGEACCGVAQSCGTGLFCNWDRCASSCGEAGQECCRPENRCFNQTTCNASTGLCQ